MEIKVTQEQGSVPVAVMHISGSISLDEPLEQKAQELYDAGSRYLVIDLGDVDFLGSVGLRAIHNIYNLMRGEKTEEEKHAIQEGIREGAYKSNHLKLLNPNENVLKVLTTTGYDMFIEIHKDLGEAVASFQAE